MLLSMAQARASRVCEEVKHPSKARVYRATLLFGHRINQVRWNLLYDVIHFIFFVYERPPFISDPPAMPKTSHFERGVFCRTLHESRSMQQMRASDLHTHLAGVPHKSGVAVDGVGTKRKTTTLISCSVTYAHVYTCWTKVLSLSNNGISACMVGGASDMRTEEDAIKGRYPLVFVTPEKVIVIGLDSPNKTCLI